MRRLEMFQKQKLSNTIIVFIVLLIITVILISTVGLKLLLNYSVLMANIFSKNSPATLNKTTDVYGTINIDNIPTATNSAKFIVSGTVINYDKIQFYLNDEKVKQIDSTASDSFSEEIGDLNPGENKLYLKAVTKDNKNSKKTGVFTVIFKEEKPKLEITDPKDGDKVNQSEITLKGSTDKEVFVKVNDLPVTVDVNGNFQTTVRLNEGDNQINVIAIDIAGNQETKSLKVTYQKE